MISGFSAVAEALVTPDLGRNVSEILPHSTSFLNGRSESLDFPSATFRGAPSSEKGIQKKEKSDLSTINRNFTPAQNIKVMFTSLSSIIFA